jgi:hypothetical protein
MSDFNISNDQKQALLQQRIDQLNLEGYNHELNLKQFEAIGAGDSVEAQGSRDAIETIKTALTVLATEIEEGN